jgi:hypothetical protein
MMITPAQVRQIHVLTSKLRLDDDAYRALLAAHGVTSSKNLSKSEAIVLIDRLTTQAVDAGVWVRPVGRSKRERIGRGSARWQNEMATPAQVNMLEAMWSQVTRATTLESRRIAFDRFIHKRFHRGGLMMVEMVLVEKIVRALEAMGAEKD